MGEIADQDEDKYWYLYDSGQLPASHYKRNQQKIDTEELEYTIKDNLLTQKLFVYGIFLNESNRKRYGMHNPSYTTVPGFVTFGSHIVTAQRTSTEGVALTGLLVDMDITGWHMLDMLERGYDRIVIETISGEPAYMYARKGTESTQLQKKEELVHEQ